MWLYRAPATVGLHGFVNCSQRLGLAPRFDGILSVSHLHIPLILELARCTDILAGLDYVESVAF